MKSNLLIEYCASARNLETGDDYLPWDLTENSLSVLSKIAQLLPHSEYRNVGSCYIHHTATVEDGAVLKDICIIGPRAFVGAHAYLRGGVYLGEASIIGPSSEVKSSFIFEHSSVSHLSFVGDSVIGTQVDIEAGAVLANHHNERPDKTISVLIGSERIVLHQKKFGALVGDRSVIGANAVTQPGTVLNPGSVVQRLSYVHDHNAH